MVEPEELEKKLREAFPGATLLTVEDLTGTKDHYKAVIVAPDFAGKSRVQQHQMVYAALGAWMAGPVHALALETRSE
ncbi:MAG: BolA family transcriptional regulator [Myxococcales bacterium]|nr:BolA family transcriptional regulator [Myxococcales bacterium]